MPFQELLRFVNVELDVLDAACLGKRGFKNSKTRWSNSGRIRSKSRNKNPQSHY